MSLNQKKITDSVSQLVRETKSTSWELLKITIPIVIITKMLEELAMSARCSQLIEPLMNLVGLPGSLGLVWASALLMNLYGAVVVFAALASEPSLNAAQVTIACSAMLIAHFLPLELAIIKKAGAPSMLIAFLRIGGASAYCWFLNLLCNLSGLWQESAAVIFLKNSHPQTLLNWSVNLLQNFVLMVIVLYLIPIIMNILPINTIIPLIERVLEPILPFFGMSKKAAPVTDVGMMMGISYGGAIIIQETRSGKLGRKEVFLSCSDRFAPFTARGCSADCGAWWTLWGHSLR